MNLAKPFTASGDALKRFGTIVLSTSAITAMWISLSVIPTSVALGFSSLDWAPAVVLTPASPATITRAATSAATRGRLIELSPHRTSSRRSDGPSGFGAEHRTADCLLQGTPRRADANRTRARTR